MAKGFNSVATAAEDIRTRKNAGGTFINRRYFRIKDGEEAVVRFLEQGEEVNSAWFHQTPPTDSRRYGDLVPCRDQDSETGERIGEDCPGCEKNYKRKFRLIINLIWRNAPIFGETDDGKTDWNNTVGFEDTVAVWDCGSEVAEDLQMLENDYNGLSSTDFKIRRRGAKLDTKYSVVPADVNKLESPLSKNDLELNKNKYDINEIIAPPSYETWGMKYKKVSAEINPSEVSAFLRKRN